MSAWLRAHQKALADTFGYLSSHVVSSLVVWGIVGIALALPAGLYLAWLNLTQMQTEWAERPAVSVFFTLGAEQVAVDNAMRRMAVLPGVTAIEYISPDDALAELGGRVALSDDLARMAENPLPASARVTVDGQTSPPGAARLADGQRGARAFAAEVEGWPEVDQVLVESQWLERLAALSSLFARLSVVIGLVLAMAALAVAGSAVRLVIQSRLEEVLVLTLVGATRPQVRRPFIYLGAWYGLGGGLAAALWLLIALGALAGPMAALSDSYGLQLSVAGFEWQLVGGILVSGIALGVLGAVVTVWREQLGSDAVA